MTVPTLYSACLPKPTLFSLALAAALASGSAALAQPVASSTTLNPVLVTTDTDEDGTTEQGYRVQTINSVGPWGARNVQDTPYSITVMPRALIENSAAKDMNQMFKMNPLAQEDFNTASDGTGNDRVTLRGFGVANPVINGIPSASRVAGTPSMFELERVDVINGATGFLYGGGRVGGAVNYVTKQSTQEDLRTLTLGSYGAAAHAGHVDLGGQFNRAKTFGYRLNAVHQDGATTRKDERKQNAVSLSLDLRPTPAVFTELRYSYKDTTATGPTIFWGDVDYSGIRKNQSFTPKWLVQEFTSHTFAHNTRWNINNVFTLRSNLMLENITKTGGDARMIWADHQVKKGSWFGNYGLRKYRKTGASIFLDSTFDTGSLSHQLTTGVSLARDHVRDTEDGYQDHEITSDISLDDFRNWKKPASWNSEVSQQPLRKSQKEEYRNLLIGDDILLNDQWSLMLGGNYATAISHSYDDDEHYEASVWTPTVSLTYKPVEHLTTYATYIESLENGTIVGKDYLNAGEVLPPYVSKQYELGMKTTLSDRLSMHTALFRLEKANRYEENTQPRPTLTRDGLQVHQGIELSIVGKLTGNLSVLAGGTLMDLSIRKDKSAALEGKSPTGVARRLAKLYVDYRVPGAPGLFLSAGAYYTGKKYESSDNTLTVPSYTVYDLGARYEIKLSGHPTTFNLSIQNLTDKVYWASTMGDPRTIVFTVKTRF